MGFALFFIGLIANNIKVIVVFGPYVVGIRAQTLMNKKPAAHTLILRARKCKANGQQFEPQLIGRVESLKGDLNGINLCGIELRQSWRIFHMR